jgi:hypothetical protein
MTIATDLSFDLKKQYKTDKAHTITYILPPYLFATTPALQIGTCIGRVYTSYNKTPI